MTPMTQSPPESQSTLHSHAIIVTIWLATLPALYFLLHHIHRLNQPIQPKGCRRLGLPPDQSNLHDEYDPKYTHGVPEDSNDDTGRPAWRVKALFIYPIKSCAGIELETANAVSTGFAYDRHFCFAENIPVRQQPDCAGNAPPSSDVTSTPATTQWTARTMRDGHFSRLALIRPEIWVPDPQAPDYTPDLDEVKSQGVMIIHYPRLLPNGHEPTDTTLGTRLRGIFLSLAITLRLLPAHHAFSIPLSPPTNTPTAAVKIWKDNPLAYDYGQYLPPSLHSFLQPTNSLNKDTYKKPLTLFATIPDHTRPIFRNAPRKESLGFQPVTAFADAYPLHLLNLASVHDVASRCDMERLSVRRFRANIIIAGPERFEEDEWKRIRFYHSSYSHTQSHRHDRDHDRNQGYDDDNDDNEYTEIHTVCRTMRCKLPNVDPATGLRHRVEPDRALRKYRCIDPGDRSNAALGMQLVPGVREFTLRVNDTIKVMERGEHCYIKMLKPGEVWEGV